MTSERIARLPEVLARTGLGRSTIYALMASARFPRAVRLGTRAVGWKESDLSDWLNSRQSNSD
ncbi:AlpA family transcriptional regulator [Rubellimicrobium roseum]|uniref:helix-turn-helix transcriptional regulator n=1 Tax=Rubellimicrobium roseum TaxID=687525 RepID=UPI00319EBBC6